MVWVVKYLRMDYSTLLNPQQLAAVTTKSQHVRIIAGAGSGKTRVLTYRISYLIGEMGVDPRRILAIAFTNKVAAEMKERAAKLVPEYGDLLSVSTFHAFCARFLRIEASAIGYPRNFTIYDEDDQSSLVKDICVDMGYRKGDDIVKASLHYIRSKKMQGKYPEDIVPNKLRPIESESECIEIFKRYEERKYANIALDFDDLLLKTIFILENFPNIREKWMYRYDHILVDEFQDTNDVQYRLMQLLLKPDTCVYVVGDPDQTIYTWRGANQNIMLNLQDQYSDLETVILNQNYRSTDVILGAANKLIDHNKKRIKKDLFTNTTNGAKIDTYKAMSAEAEAQWVGEKIEAIARENGGDYTKIAVLYRSSYVTRPFESEFAARGIQYRIFGGLRFYQRMEVKDVLAYFRLIVNPKDDVSFDRIYNTPKRGIGEASLSTLKKEAAEAGLSEYEYIQNLDANASNLPTRVINALSILVTKMEKCKADLADNYETYSSTLKKFIEDIDYFKFIAEQQEVDEDRVGNVNALFDDINHFISRNPESTFEEYLQNVSLLTSQDDMNGGNYVSLMTIHVAKGLEFDNVFVICMNQGAFPSMRAMMETGRDGEEEERRLAYVALTRAKKKLFMSCNTSYSYVTDSRSEPSIFFEESGMSFPASQDARIWGSSYGTGRNNSYGGGYGRGSSSPWKSIKKPNTSSSSFFSDGDAISPFEEPKPKEKKVERPETNGITDWKVGDIAIHEKFGEGVVKAIINGTIIVVEFAEHGKKTLLSNHPLLSRKASKGGLA